MKLLIFVLALVLASLGTQAQTLTVPSRAVKMYVTKVYDGDGARALDANGKIHVLRFAGTNSPEFENLYCDSTQTYARESRDSMRALILHDTVLVDQHPFQKKRTSYGREVVDVYLLDGRLVNLISVERGWAWSKQVSGRRDMTIGDAINNAYIAAKKLDVGLWGMKGYKTSPTTWLFQHRREQFNHFKK